jgi:hypothetical protein
MICAVVLWLKPQEKWPFRAECMASIGAAGVPGAGPLLILVSAPGFVPDQPRTSAPAHCSAHFTIDVKSESGP